MDETTQQNPMGGGALLRGASSISSVLLVSVVARSTMIVARITRHGVVVPAFLFSVYYFSFLFLVCYSCVLNFRKNAFICIFFLF